MRLLLNLLISSWLFTALACEYTNEDDLFGEDNCDPQQVTYSAVIQPLISASCAISGCHDGNTPGLPDWSKVENVQAQSAIIKQRTADRTMPPSSSGISLTSTEIANVACWVDSGALNN